MNARIGIYAGTFDPIHNGHIGFAEQAIKQAVLDNVYFLVEPSPRYKTNVTSLDTRKFMLNLAIAPHHNLKLLELTDASFSVTKTLPQLITKFTNKQLVFLFGSDVYCHIPQWHGANELARAGEFVVSIRNNHDSTTASQVANQLHLKTTIIHSQYPEVSSQKIRQNVAKNIYNSIPENLATYIKTNNIY